MADLVPVSSTSTVPVGLTSQVFIPPHTIIGGENIARVSAEAFATDMRLITQAAMKNSEAWAEIGITGARRSLDFYTAVAFNNITQDQTGATKTSAPVDNTKQAVADKQLVSTPSAMSGIDNANLNSTQGQTTASNSIAAGIANALQSVLPGLIASAVSNALANQTPSAKA